MKRIIAFILILIICLSTVACGGNTGGADVTLPSTSINDGVHIPGVGVEGHTDENSDKYCDECGISVVTTFDFYAINDLHGKFVNSSNTVGVEGLTTYLKKSAASDDNPIFLSSGDMWQGGAESNLTKGAIVTDWMNAMGFASMTLGNHEFDWGEDYVESNDSIANFPFLAINIYDKSTNKQVEYCQSSVVIECNGLQVGIIGAAGDNYSSISSDKVEDIYFKTGYELTSLVKRESEKLRSEGVDIIVYSLHDGYSQSSSGVKDVSNSALGSYYDIALSNGYVDIVFEGHTHRGYVLRDSHGIYHLQNSGDNGGVSHAELEYNFANGDCAVTEAEQVSSAYYGALAADPVVSDLLAKYDAVISKASEVLGNNPSSIGDDALRSLVAKLYFEKGFERWGDKYNIVLGGGFLTVRSPGYLRSGTLTYGDVQAVLPFENEIVLCSVKGRELSSKFINSSNSNYFVYLGEYGNSIKNNIDYNATYYLITDTYTSQYAPNKLTVIEKYDSSTFACNLVAEHIKNGGLG